MSLSFSDYDHQDLTTILSACQNGYRDKIEEYIKKNSYVFYNYKQLAGEESILNYAIRCKRPEIVEIIIENYPLEGVYDEKQRKNLSLQETLLTGDEYGTTPLSNCERYCEAVPEIKQLLTSIIEKNNSKE
jgi:hypothetical protein